MLRMLFSLCVAGLVSGPARLHAQPRQPAEGAVAVGGAAGIFFPSEDGLESAPHLEGQFQYQFSPRLGVRFGVGWTDTDFDREDEDSLRQVRLGADVIYNWERGAWHPYATAGIGWYRFRLTDEFIDDDDLETESRFGVNLGGGIEYFFTRRDTFTSELQFHLIPGDFDGLLSGYDANYWSWSAVYKHYFGR